MDGELCSTDGVLGLSGAAGGGPLLSKVKVSIISSRLSFSHVNLQSNRQYNVVMLREGLEAVLLTVKQ